MIWCAPIVASTRHRARHRARRLSQHQAMDTVDAASTLAAREILGLIDIQVAAAERDTRAVTAAGLPLTVRAGAAARVVRLQAAAAEVTASTVARNVRWLPPVNRAHLRTYHSRPDPSPLAAASPWRVYRKYEVDRRTGH